jgi:hypothetical protein
VSWDVDIGPPFDGPCPHCHCTPGPRPIASHTSNLNDMLRAAWGGRTWWDLADAPTDIVLQHVRTLIAAIEDDPVKYDAMNPPNGWGDRIGLVAVMKEAAEVLEATPSTWRLRVNG